MNDLLDLRLTDDGSDPGPERLPESQDPGGGGRGKVLALILLLLLLLGGGAWYFLAYRQPPPPPVTAPPPASLPAPPAEAPEESAPAFEVPPLDASDQVLRGLVTQLSSHPELIRWLATEDLARRFVAAVVNVGEGQIPRAHLPFLAPKEKFAALLDERGTVRLDSEGFQRYRLAVDVFTSLDTEGSAELLRQLRPLFQQAYEELGYPGRSFDDALRAAATRILTTPVVEGPVDLAPQVLGYEFADPALEARPPVQKLLIRTGPENTRRVQAKVRELWEALGL
jgi:hypothetical protein